MICDWVDAISFQGQVDENVDLLVEGMTGGYFWEGEHGSIRHPPPYVHKDFKHHGLLWWRSTLLQWLMRTNGGCLMLSPSRMYFKCLGTIRTLF